MKCKSEHEKLKSSLRRLNLSQLNVLDGFGNVPLLGNAHIALWRLSMFSCFNKFDISFLESTIYWQITTFMTILARIYVRHFTFYSFVILHLSNRKRTRHPWLPLATEKISVWILKSTPNLAKFLFYHTLLSWAIIHQIYGNFKDY